MTDKQLAMLIRQIAGRVRALAVEIEPLIESGVMETIRDMDTSSFQAAISGQTVETTRLAAVNRILNLALDLEDESELLERPVKTSTDQISFSDN